ncbi:hypothetical protein HKX48_006975 [Thoreauomyces humboldtii]|nr:hypothetical protein HKX48_006975 [Thoreauomyces humboldtii]
MTVTFVLRLGDEGSAEGRKQYVRLPPPPEHPYNLRFVITAGSLASNKPVLFTNYPAEGSAFKRNAFRSLIFEYDVLSDPTLDVPILAPGVFQYYVEYQDWETGSRVRQDAKGTFVVDPRLLLAAPKTTGSERKSDADAHERALADMETMHHSQTTSGKTLLPLNGVSMLTVIPKWMPTLSSWPQYFAAFSKTGYNMVHFAPLNARGISNSPYSIFDQLALSDDLFDATISESEKEKELKSCLDKIRIENRILSATDIVWNHTACNSSWLLEHPEAGYNLATAPHLRSALEIEDALLAFSAEITESIDNAEQLETILNSVRTKVLPSVKLWEFYVVNVEAALAEMTAELSVSSREVENPPKESFRGKTAAELVELLRSAALIDKVDGNRFAKLIDVKKAASFLQLLSSDLPTLEVKLERYKQLLNDINLIYYKEHDEDLSTMLNNIASRAKYLRVEPHGPRLGKLTSKNPLVDLYFTRLPKNEITKGRHRDELSLANNGWIWNADPLVNFAAAESKAYLRREVIAWGDCVKLRYGNEPEDSPWLWSHQIAYTKKMARLFDGLRIDNCHSTPLHVASALLDAAREENPDLYVFAELFTGSEEQDIMFVAQLGINSLIREAMNADSPKELSRLVHRHGGQPVGSMTLPPESFPLKMLGLVASSPGSRPAELSETLVQLTGSSPHALFMDCTHDNETPHQRRAAVDTLANAAIVAMSDCAVGSVFGYDEIVPNLLDLVNETRKYPVPEHKVGIHAAKSVLYKARAKMAADGYAEVHVNQEHDFTSIHRLNPVTHEGYLLVARSAFKKQDSTKHGPIKLLNQNVKLLVSAELTMVNEPSGEGGLSMPCQLPSVPATTSNLSHGSANSGATGYISSLPCTLFLSDDLSTKKTGTTVTTNTVGKDGDFETVISIGNFPPGSFDLYRTFVSEPRQKETSGLYPRLWRLLGIEKKVAAYEIMLKLGHDVIGSGHCWYSDDKATMPPGLWEATKDLNTTDLNIALYRCGTEEEDTIGDGAYDVPGYGKLVYCGLQGLVSALQPIARENNLGHAIFGNLRSGTWIADYIFGRLEKHLPTYPRLAKLRDWLLERLSLVKRMSASFIPKYYCFVVFSAYHALIRRALSKSKSSKETAFDRPKSSLEALQDACSLMTFQLYGRVQSTGLVPATYPLEPLLARARPDGVDRERTPALAAGLPHFASQYMRCWGRDIFISLPGCFLQSGDFEAARAHLIAFGSTLRHGLIPNLLDQGIGPRYNARDAAWWWLYGVTQYCRSSPEGYAFLGVQVARRFIPKKRYRNPDYLAATEDEDDGAGDTYCAFDDASSAFMHKSTIAQLCHEIMERHAHGQRFREHNAGPRLDHAMRSEGFDLHIGVDWRNGLVEGGNRWNCGTWMDKMGDSEKARTKGVPATPRDGAAVEIVGLTKSALRWIVDDVLGKGLGAEWWKWDAVQIKDSDGNPKNVTYAEWNTLLQISFEKYFYIPIEPREDASHAVGDPKLIHRRGIYKDTVGASLDFMSFQLRPNICMAMVVAPELFDPDHARTALDIVKTSLVGPLGIKTLDPDDWAYRGVYDNANDGEDAAIAHGFNYHQGPEWVYPLGFFLRAYLYFFARAPGHDPTKIDEVYLYIQRVLLRHKEHILDGSKSPYAGLPELTNAEGAFCSGSCPTQAWSGAVMVELISDLLDGAH